MQTVLVTGGAGYIGSVLTKCLLDAGHRVRVLDRFFFGQGYLQELAQSHPLTLVKDDIRYLNSSVVEGVDVVIDLAGIPNDPACDLMPEVARDVNAMGPARLAALARKAGVKRYIYSSSCSIYGQGKEKRLTEKSSTAPVSLYAQLKIDTEQELFKLQDDKFAVTALRNATVYGLSPRMRFDLVINIMTLTAYKQHRIHVLGGGRQWRPLVHVYDVARAFLAVLEAPLQQVAGEIFNVGSNEQNYQIIQVAHLVRDIIPQVEIIEVPDDADKRSYNVDFSKFARVLGFQPARTPADGIKEIARALERGALEETVLTKTVSYYRYLMDAHATLKEVLWNGNVF